ncbi:MAG: 50S ribosomal protein L15 [Verrucomicrobia bacterium]|nr:50S ribosomal protein L15 [Verrucomicrobiota bacterium]MCG2678997.1 50S ribosomal protein L15 [Kiritimatiellia bacterium]MBU4248349.1 50S ribosomal protein L15 [Verrucomicrobiota bacterium]MBU4289734.1 50S ribosomal protein L15 [Verrucomicrobiota bacterium]MBU4428552.1 50S ribosomal protein L15 [Verrucomicrobiota bacterium]
MNLHTLRVTPGAKRPKMRVGCGRGSGKGKTCGRGHKGQYARSGHKHKPAFEGGQMRLIRRIPKRGFNQGHKVVFEVVPVDSLNRFDNGTEISPATLKKAGLLKGRSVSVKILGDGTLTKKLAVKAQAFSQSAQRKITEAGGTWAVIE